MEGYDDYCMCIVLIGKVDTVLGWEIVSGWAVLIWILVYDLFTRIEIQGLICVCFGGKRLQYGTVLYILGMYLYL